MKGFDNKFKNLPDYILGITQEIWEQRGLATLHDYYAEHIPVRSPGSMVIGLSLIHISEPTRPY